VRRTAGTRIIAACLAHPGCGREGVAFCAPCARRRGRLLTKGDPGPMFELARRIPELTFLVVAIAVAYAAMAMFSAVESTEVLTANGMWM